MEVAITFKISEDLARKLSDCLIKKNIYMEAFTQVIPDIDKCKYIEKQLLDLENEITSLKSLITEQVPDLYRSDDYEWKYNGYAVDGTTVRIYKVA